MTDYNFGDFDGLDTGMPEQDRWEYPTIGYNATTGVFYVGENEQKQIDGITLFAMRQCKEIADAAGVIHRYPLKTPRAQMVDGDFTSRLQVIAMVDGELYTFGARSWTARAAFANPAGGPYSDANFEQGLWGQLFDHIKHIQKTAGKTAPPLCWEFNIVVADKAVTVGTGKNTSKSYPFKRAGDFAFVGPDRARANAALFEAEALNEWAAEWGKRVIETPPEEQPDEPIIYEPDEIAF